MDYFAFGFLVFVCMDSEDVQVQPLSWSDVSSEIYIYIYYHQTKS